MTKNKKRNVAFLVVIFCVVLVFGIKFAVEYYRSSSVRSSHTARIKGDKKAPVKITEFIDFQCPACAFGALYLKEFMQQNPAIVQLEMKYHPFKMHAHAYLSSQYAECAARQDKFWAFHDMILERQSNWSKLTNARPAFDVIAQEVGLDQNILNECLRDPAINEIIMDDKQEGAKLGIRSTPSYIINGKLFVGGKALKEELSKYINGQ